MLKVIGVGDNVVDRYLHQGMMYPGGNSVNFAVYARQLGCEAAYMGVLADDVEGRFLIDTLKGQGIGLPLCELVHGETGRCSTQLVEGDRIISDDNDLGAVKATPLQLTPERLEEIRGYDLAHSSCYTFIDDQLGKIKATGTTLVYDFSDGWSDESFERICPNINVAFFSGKKLPDDELKGYLKKAIDLGCELAICTIGKRGAFIYNGHKFYTKLPYNLEGKVVDTLGAGDAFLTGFIVTWALGKKHYKALTTGAEYTVATADDAADYEDSLIQHAMSRGNLLAIRTCMYYGAFGMGAPLPGEA